VNFELTDTTEKPTESFFWTTTSRQTKSPLPAQKNLRTSELTFESTQLGICTKDAIYQMATMALPLYDSELIFQEVKHFETASIQGFQFAAAISLKPLKIPSAFIVLHDQSMATGRSERHLQEPSQGL